MAGIVDRYVLHLSAGFCKPPDLKVLFVFEETFLVEVNNWYT